MTVLSMANAKRVIRYCVENDMPVYFEGAPGIGKTQIFRQVAEELDYIFLDYRLLLRDPVDLRGLPVPDLENGLTRWLKPDDLPFLPYSGKRCFVMIDEIDRASPAMQGTALGLVLERCVGSHRLHPETRIGAAGNGKTDAQGTLKMSRALTSRFSCFQVEADAKAVAAHFSGKGLPAVVSAFLRFRPELACNYQDKDLKTPPNPRSWEEVAKMVTTAPADLLDSLVASRVGQTAADEFRGFRQIFNSVDSPDVILADPMKARVPGAMQISAQWAIATALARVVTRQTFGAAVTYLNRFETTEYLAAFMVDSVARDKTLKTTQGFVQWQVENQDVTL